MRTFNMVKLEVDSKQFTSFDIHKKVMQTPFFIIMFVNS